MILKKLKRTNLLKTKAAMIGGLVDYILAAKDEDGYQKLQFAYAKNVITTKPEAWKQEMIALAEESIHSKMPVTHWVMSWQENEVPTREQVKEAVGIFLEGMGLKDHQAIVAAHVNTANYHVHIVVNRVHPLIEKVVQPHKGFDIEAAHRIAAEIEHKQGSGPVMKTLAIGSTSRGRSPASSRPRSSSPRPRPQTLRTPQAKNRRNA